MIYHKNVSDRKENLLTLLLGRNDFSKSAAIEDKQFPSQYWQGSRSNMNVSLSGVRKKIHWLYWQGLWPEYQELRLSALIRTAFTGKSSHHRHKDGAEGNNNVEWALKTSRLTYFNKDCLLFAIMEPAKQIFLQKFSGHCVWNKISIRIRHLPKWSWGAAGSLCNTVKISG